MYIYVLYTVVVVMWDYSDPPRPLLHQPQYVPHQCCSSPNMCPTSAAPVICLRPRHASAAKQDVNPIAYRVPNRFGVTTDLLGRER